MANHAWVKTRKVMKPEQISDIIENLNKTKFKNLLKVDYHLATLEEPGWGEHTWLVSLGKMQKVCWLETSRHFEISHGGGGGSLLWWLDISITNDVALRFNGNISDDGVSGKWKGKENYFPTLKSYLEDKLSFLPTEDREKAIKQELEFNEFLGLSEFVS
ncbi:MAG: hypothetical protein EKK64_00755 [Neisseriaceae bacterium]|nr:MAG: hypothetical protein EKK64_00755 [Neisseriaceae bacterium]